ncbi:MAG TPA: 30S ribosomal protein S2 [Patescibacteria group bacterium]|nr:30S ribosomal protein S2 [Patescibacteria group bacterium]
MREITLEELLEAGCHFGHQVTRQNPKARDFVFEARDGIHIIDLGKTKEGLDETLAYLKSVAEKEGTTMLIVGTKRQAAPIIEEEMKALVDNTSIYYVTKRWIGGTLTNPTAIQKNFDRLRNLEKKLKSEEEQANYTKKEVGEWEKERAKLHYFYSGIVDMKNLPDVLFVVDTHLEGLAVREANRMGIPVAGIVDTNADPDPIQYIIPANDDAIGSLKLLIGAVVDAWNEGKTGTEVKRKPAKAEKGTEEKEAVKEEVVEEKPAKEEKKASTEEEKPVKKEAVAKKAPKKVKKEEK